MIEAIVWSVACGILFALYFSNYIDLYVLQSGLDLVFAILCSYAFAYVTMKVLSEKDSLKRYKIGLALGGALMCSGIIFFSVVIINRILNLPPTPPFLGWWAFILLVAVIAPTIGGLLGYWLGYWLGKRRHL